VSFSTDGLRSGTVIGRVFKALFYASRSDTRLPIEFRRSCSAVASWDPAVPTLTYFSMSSKRFPCFSCVTLSPFKEMLKSLI
jgi:hypothetical protein